MSRNILAILMALGLSSMPLAANAEEAGYQGWIEDMKQQTRGPFSRLRWFCNDGTVLPPKAYACKDHGGGHQHGQWSERTVTLREKGYLVANILAGIDPQELTSNPNFYDQFAQMLIEKYLVAADDGWIMRKAQFYRGAIQEEDEREGAKLLLEHLAAAPEWNTTRFSALRSGARLLPHGQASASAQKVRQESAALQDKDKGFARLRAKIHGSPDAGDAALVRDYASSVQNTELKQRYLSLADMIDGVYQREPLQDTLQNAIKQLRDDEQLQKRLQQAINRLVADNSPASEFAVTATLLADIRNLFGSIKKPATRLQMLDLSLLLEDANFGAASELRPGLDSLTRQQQLSLIGNAAKAAYGTGLMKSREFDALQGSLKKLSQDSVSLKLYLDELRYLARVPGWGTQNQRFFFFESMQKLAEIEPRAMLFIQDQLRGSPLLFYSALLNNLSRDGNRLAGVRHKVFGEEIGTGFNALNPGIAVGVLHASPDLEKMEEFEPDAIYVLPETVSDLPPIAGILTAGEGNPLSHVQLLARNLGIPNVSFNEELTSLLKKHDGKKVVMAVSPAGLVEISPFDAAWQARFGGEEQSGGVVIRPDLEKLDLSVNRFMNLDDLRAKDSGSTVGPKAAKLGELRHAFPSAVAPGTAIPFGIFKSEVLDKPYKDSGNSIYDWMVENYRTLEKMPAGDEREEKTEAFRAELYDLILNTKHSQAFKDQLKQAMLEAFNSTETGVFVRSDTNVEDLPGFTGAGLNLTLPNVIGLQELQKSINRVWASPFTARAFAWRQSHMEGPEHVYTSILILKSVASDKSGVLVTQDLDTGDRETISVAVNEGLGGAVDGQAAESLRINTRNGDVKLLATATAPWYRRPAAGGGIEKLPSTGSDSVLKPDEIKRLIAFARDELPVRFPPITDDEGNPAAADIEFGFLDGNLRLFQIRPFLESRSARGNSYLIDMDSALSSAMNKQVDLQEALVK